MRDVFINPPKEFKISQDKLIKHIKPLYGLCDGGDYWERTLKNNLQKELGMDNFVNVVVIF